MKKEKMLKRKRKKQEDTKKIESKRVNTNQRAKERQKVCIRSKQQHTRGRGKCHFQK
jgi:hypothetical protein